MAKQNITEEKEYFVNMGPQHPSTHGVLRLLLKLEGEIVRNVEPHLGYIHSGIEKMCEFDTYPQTIHLTDRMDYLSAHQSNEAVCLCVEKALEMEVPERAKYIRTIFSELTRIASHQLWWGAFAMDLGALTPFFYAFRDREMVLNIFEETCGARLTPNYNCIGGVSFDIHDNFRKKVHEFITEFRKRLPEYETLFSGNVIFQERSKGVGILSKEDAINFGVTGPTGRGSGWSCDVRKHHPYSAYDKVQFNEMLSNDCDTFARYNCRMKEMYESMNIIEQLIDNIPEGDFCAKTKAIIKLPVGEFYQRIESSRGEFGVYIISDGNKSPYRMKFRSPGFSNLSVLNHIGKGWKIADVVAIMASFDLVIPDIDR